MKVVKIILLLFISLAANAQVPTDTLVVGAESNSCACSKNAFGFTDDDASLFYLMRNTKYPDAARDCGCVGTVVIEFTIDTTGAAINPIIVSSPKPCETQTPHMDGSVTSGEITDGPCTQSGKLMETESIRVITNIPKSEPKKQNGKPIAYKVILPIRFEIY